MNDLISVIVPVYKVEKYLRKCIDSILIQTYTNLEVILVDDGSPDNCGNICDKYAKKDKRIHVIHKKNGGLSEARNFALNIAKGKYVTFIDSDDYIESDYIDYLYFLINTNNADLSICTYKYIDERGNTLNHIYDSGNIKELNQKQALSELLNSKYFSNSAWGKLYKTEHFKNIRYPVGKLYEDVPTTYKIFFQCEKVVLGFNPLYNYLYRTSAISKQKFSESRLDAVYFAEEMVKNITKKYPDLSNIATCRLFDSYTSILSIIDKNKDEKFYLEIINKIKHIRKSVLINKKSGIKRRLRSVCSFLKY